MQAISHENLPHEVLILEAAQIERAKTDPGKFEPLYKKYHEPIFRFIYQRMDDKEQAFDLTQEVFVKALTNINKYEYRGYPFSSWLYRIAFNELNQLFRSQKVQRTVNIDSVNVQEMISEMEETYSEAYFDQLAELLSGLPEEELQLFEMRFFEKRSFKEMAEILEATEAALKMKLYRSLEKLKKVFTK